MADILQTPSTINIRISDDSEIKKLNSEHRGKNEVTDVLSFEMNEKRENGESYLGDVIVNLDQAKRQAKEYGNSVEEEVAELVGHGVLHLLGVHHDGDSN